MDFRYWTERGEAVWTGLDRTGEGTIVAIFDADRGGAWRTDIWA